MIDHGFYRMPNGGTRYYPPGGMPSDDAVRRDDLRMVLSGEVIPPGARIMNLIMDPRLPGDGYGIVINVRGDDGDERMGHVARHLQ